jgi:hypothetical protein
MDFHQLYGVTKGPLGIPMSDKQAYQTENLLMQLPDADREIKRFVIQEKMDLEPQSRIDLSWITTEDPDHAGDVVLASGMNDSIYSLNPVVPLCHSYWMPPVGRSLSRELKVIGNKVGIQARTYYPTKPEGHTQPWPSDETWAMVMSGLLNAKSIGFIGKADDLTDQEREKWPKGKRIYRSWTMLEYSVCPFGMNPQAVVTQISKSFALDFGKAIGLPPEKPTPHVTLATAQAVMTRAVEAALNKMLGRV